MYKPRTYIYREFETHFQQLINKDDVVLEIGAGYGSTAFPLIETLQHDITYIATDYSLSALEVMKAHKLYNPSRIITEVWDVVEPISSSSSIMKYNIPKVILCIFTLSAISPSNHFQSLLNIVNMMDDKSVFLFRDYGMYDSTMFRHKIKLHDKFYMRQDETYCYYFDIDYLTDLTKAVGLSIIDIKVATISSVNRKKQSQLKRVFIHMVAKKRVI